MGRYMAKDYPIIRIGTLSMKDPRHVTHFIARIDKNLPIPAATTTGVALEVPYKMINFL